MNRSDRCRSVPAILQGNQLVFMPSVSVGGCMGIAGGNRSNDEVVGNRPTSAYVMCMHVRLFGMPGALRHCSLPGRLSLAHLVLFKLRSLA